MALARTASVKPQLATLAGPTRIAAGWAHAKWSVLGRMQRRYVVLASCMLEVFEDERARAPLLSVCVVGGSLLPIPQRREMQLRAGGQRVVVQWRTEREMRACVAAFNYANRDIGAFYKLVSHRMLAAGRASRVVFAFDVASGIHAAVKIVSKAASRPTDRVFAEREVAIRSSVQHPALVQTLDIFESPSELYLVMEFMSGGTLAQRMVKQRMPLDEDTARIVMARAFCALRHLHSRGVVHRNVKPANLLLDETEDARWAHTVKLSDLSLACRVDDPEAALAVVGTPEYLAPEAATMVSAADGSRSVVFDVAADMWAAGVTLYNLLSLALPFDAPSAPQVLRKVRTAAFDFSPPAFINVSPEAQSLICALLNPNPRKRLTAASAPYHPWFGAQGAIRTVAPRPAPRRSARARLLVPAPPTRALIRLRAAVAAVTAMQRLSGGSKPTPRPPSLGVPGVASFVSVVGGVDISPRRPRARTPPASSRISNSSTVLSRSSASDELGSPPYGTQPARVPRGPSPMSGAGWRAARAEAFARASSYRREKSVGPVVATRRSDEPRIEPSRSQPNIGGILNAAQPRREDIRTEKKWSLREAWDSSSLRG